MIHDLRLAVRLLRRSPGFTLAAALTLALGIGANSAIFSVTNAALLSWREALHEPERLVMLWKSEAQYGNWQTTPADFRDWRERNTVFEEMAGFDYHSWTLRTASGGDTERAAGGSLDPGFFALLGVAPRLGREFVAEEALWGHHRVVLLSDHLWRERFGSDPEILNRDVILDGEKHTIIGVMPPGAWFAPTRVDLWRPLSHPDAASANARNRRWHHAVGRLAAGVSRSKASVEMAALAERIAEEHPINEGWSIALTPFEESHLGKIGPMLSALGGAVGLVLLLACVNVAALVLARSEGRLHEMSVRAALGASRGRLASMVFAEGVALSTLGGLLGLTLAYFGTDRLLRLAPAEIPRLHETGVSVDSKVLVFTLVLSLVTAFLFALAPALRSSRPGPAGALGQASRGAVGDRRGRRFRAAVVVAEVALSALLLIGAGLLVRTLTHLTSVELGVRDSGLLTLEIEPPLEATNDANRVEAFYQRTIERVEALPGVHSAGMTSELPLMEGGPGYYFGIEGVPDPPTLGEVPIIRLGLESGRSLQTLGVELMRGRHFDDRDRRDAERVALIDQRMVDRYFAGMDPIGKIIRLGPPEHLWPEDELPTGGRFPRYRVVGVTRDVRYQAFDDLPGAVAYIPIQQRHLVTMAWTPDFLVAHTDGEPMAALPGVRAVLRDLDPNQPLGLARTLEDLSAEAFRATSFAVRLFSLFAGLALTLAVIGIYGVIAYSVARRRREIGVRVALGAERRHVIGLLSRQIILNVALGLALGIGGALLSTRYLETLLRGVSRTDPATFGAVALILVAVASVAAYLPARRAAEIAPTEALRSEG